MARSLRENYVRLRECSPILPERSRRKRGHPGPVHICIRRDRIGSVWNRRNRYLEAIMHAVVRSHSGPGACFLELDLLTEGGGREEPHRRRAWLRQLYRLSERRRRHHGHGLSRQDRHRRVPAGAAEWVKETSARRPTRPHHRGAAPSSSSTRSGRPWHKPLDCATPLSPARVVAESCYARSGHSRPTGWSVYGAQWSQPVATGGKSSGRKRLKQRRPLPTVATS